MNESSDQTKTQPAPSTPAQPQWRPVEAVCTFLIPGSGYLLLGQYLRAFLVGGLVIALFISGLLIGGISIVDRQSSNSPFTRLGQTFIAASFVSDAVRKRYMEMADSPHRIDLNESPSANPQVKWRYTPSFGRMEEVGVLYTAVAGMLNLLSIIDVAYHPPRPRRKEQA